MTVLPIKIKLSALSLSFRINMLSLYEKIKIRLIILFLLAALSFIGLFFIINYQLVSERAVKRADSRFELI